MNIFCDYCYLLLRHWYMKEKNARLRFISKIRFSVWLRIHRASAWFKKLVGKTFVTFSMHITLKDGRRNKCNLNILPRGTLYVQINKERSTLKTRELRRKTLKCHVTHKQQKASFYL